MNISPDKVVAVLIGLTGGFARYIHLILSFDTTLLTRMIEPVCTGVLCVFGSLLAKDMYRWVKSACFRTVFPWIKSFLTRKK